MFILTAVILLINKLLLARKDGMSFLLKEKDYDGPHTHSRINRWHRDGVMLDALFTAVLAWASGNYYEVVFQSLLLRLAVYDIAFNKFAQLDINHLGSTAIWDKIFSAIFGERGAVKKSLFFLAALVIWGVTDIFI